MEIIEQACIALSGSLAIWLSWEQEPLRRRWAPVFGLAGQPFWIHAAWAAGQWGALLAAVAFTAAWARGFWMHWGHQQQREIS